MGAQSTWLPQATHIISLATLIVDSQQDSPGKIVKTYSSKCLSHNRGKKTLVSVYQKINERMTKYGFILAVHILLNLHRISIRKD